MACVIQTQIEIQLTVTFKARLRHSFDKRRAEYVETRLQDFVDDVLRCELESLEFPDEVK